jgi:hypothetical protein
VIIAHSMSGHILSHYKAASAAAGVSIKQLTSPGPMLGKAAHMSPEKALGEKLDALDDEFRPSVR